MTKEKKNQNTEEDYKKVLATDDPTQISKDDLENFAKEAIKKFKSLN